MRLVLVSAWGRGRGTWQNSLARSSAMAFRDWAPLNLRKAVTRRGKLLNALASFAAKCRMKKPARPAPRFTLDREVTTCESFNVRQQLAFCSPHAFLANSIAFPYRPLLRLR